MRPRKPSPAMVVALIALVMATTGTAIAAVEYASNAGAVDRLSAVGARATNAQARGKLVATARGGPDVGKIPFKFLAGAASSEIVARGKNGAALIPVADNGETTLQTLIDLEVGNLQVSCLDESDRAGRENPATIVGVTNHTGGGLNLARRLGTGSPSIATVENNTVHKFTVGAENTFEVHLHQGAKTVLVEGVARQVNAGTADGSCAIYATALLVE